MTLFFAYDRIDLVLQIAARIQSSTLLELNCLMLRKKFSAEEFISEFLRQFVNLRFLLTMSFVSIRQQFGVSFEVRCRAV